MRLGRLACVSSLSKCRSSLFCQRRLFVSRLVDSITKSTDVLAQQVSKKVFAADAVPLTELRRPFEKRRPLNETLAERVSQQQNQAQHVQPAAIRVSKCKQYLTIQWEPDAKGTIAPPTRILAELLRVESPSTDVKGMPEIVIYGRRGIQIRDVVPMGRYALRLVFSDGHTGGIFPYEYLQWLGKEKFKMMRQYISRLKEKRKSRVPPVTVASKRRESANAKKVAEHRHGPGCKH